MARIQMNYPGVGTASLDLCLPVEADGGTWKDAPSPKRWPVIWLLHGEGESCGDWFRYTLAEEYANQAGVALVCPTIENSFGVNLKRGDPWENFLTGSLRQCLFSMFPLSEKREENWIAGYSMGGYAALRLAFRHPELYAGVAAFNPIVDLSGEKLSYWWNPQQLDYVFESEEPYGSGVFIIGTSPPMPRKASSISLLSGAGRKRRRKQKTRSKVKQLGISRRISYNPSDLFPCSSKGSAASGVAE